jgi:ABC-type glycerol-3-phosphate transport system substrate-binding protein
MPLDDLVKKDNVDTAVYLPSLMSLVGKVNGVTYMLPFYNYSMGIIYRKCPSGDIASHLSRLPTGEESA